MHPGVSHLEVVCFLNNRFVVHVDGELCCKQLQFYCCWVSQILVVLYEYHKYWLSCMSITNRRLSCMQNGLGVGGWGGWECGASSAWYMFCMPMHSYAMYEQWQFVYIVFSMADTDWLVDGRLWSGWVVLVMHTNFMTCEIVGCDHCWIGWCTCSKFCSTYSYAYGWPNGTRCRDGVKVLL